MAQESDGSPLTFFAHLVDTDANDAVLDELLGMPISQFPDSNILSREEPATLTGGGAENYEMDLDWALSAPGPAEPPLSSPFVASITPLDRMTEGPPTGTSSFMAVPTGNSSTSPTSISYSLPHTITSGNYLENQSFTAPVSTVNPSPYTLPAPYNTSNTYADNASLCPYIQPADEQNIASSMPYSYNTLASCPMPPTIPEDNLQVSPVPSTSPASAPRRPSTVYLAQRRRSGQSTSSSSQEECDEVGPTLKQVTSITSLKKKIDHDFQQEQYKRIKWGFEPLQRTIHHPNRKVKVHKGRRQTAKAVLADRGILSKTPLKVSHINCTIWARNPRHNWCCPICMGRKNAPRSYKHFRVHLIGPHEYLGARTCPRCSNTVCRRTSISGCRQCAPIYRRYKKKIQDKKRIYWAEDPIDSQVLDQEGQTEGEDEEEDYQSTDDSIYDDSSDDGSTPPTGGATTSQIPMTV